MNERADPVSLEIERAATLIELGRLDEAASSLHRLLGHDPENGAAWCLLGQAQLGREDSEAALDAADHAVAVAPESEWGHRLRSAALGAMGRHDAAIAAAREAIRLAPDEWEGHVGLSQALTRADRGAEAISAAEHAVGLAPHVSDAHLVVGDAFATADRPKEAEAAYRRALELDPQDSVAHNNLARVKMRKARYDVDRLADAAAGFQTAVRSDPHGSVASHNLELTLRVFLTRLSYLIFIAAFISWRIHVGSLFIVVLLCALAVFCWRFVSRIDVGLRRHLLYTITHGTVGLAAALQLGGILALLYAVVTSSAYHGVSAGIAWALTLTARLILGREVAAIAGVKLLNERSLRILAIGLGLIAFVFAISATSDTGGQRELDAVVAVASFGGMIYAIRRRRALPRPGR